MARILVIDDDAAIAHVIRLTLEPHGHEVLVANDGSRGFALAQRQPADAVILDLMMPVMDGPSLLESLRLHERTASTPVLIISAIDIDDAERQCRELGVERFLQKPFRSEELLRSVEAMLSSQVS